MSRADQPAAAGQQATTTRDWQPRGGARCVCGAAVAPEAARVLGVAGVVPACPACWSSHEDRHRYATVTSAVVHFRDGTGFRAPDVAIDETHPEVDG